MAINQYEKWRLPSLNGSEKDVFIEANYYNRKKNEFGELETQNENWSEQVIKLKIGEEESEIKVKDFWLIAFLLSGDKEQTMIAPIKTEQVRFINQWLKIRCNKCRNILRVKHTVKIPDKFFSEIKTSSGLLISQINREGKNLISGAI